MPDSVSALDFFPTGRPYPVCPSATRGEHADFLEAAHKILAFAPPHSPEHPWLNKLKGKFG